MYGREGVAYGRIAYSFSGDKKKIENYLPSARRNSNQAGAL